MKYLIYLLLIIVVFSVNIGVLAHFKFFGTVPNLLLLIVIFTSADKSLDNDFLWVAFFSGLLLDAYSGLLIGTFTVPFLLVALLLKLITEKIIVYELSWKYSVILLIFATACLHALLWGYGLVTGILGWFPYAVSWQNTSRLFLPELLYNILLLYPIYLLVQWVKRLVSKAELNKRRLA